MFERYTEQARRSIFFARYTAGCQRAAHISAAHFLIGLCHESKGRASEIASLKGRAPELCALLGLQWPIGTATKEQLRADMPLDNNAKMALAYAAQEADSDQEYWIDTDHLLRALLCFHNEASPALESVPLDLASLRTLSRRHRSEFPPARTPIVKISWLWLGPIKRALVKLAILALVGLIAGLVIRWLNY
jgi:ATP-dependent Clp protease ATP-binding subunit ClpC